MFFFDVDREKFVRFELDAVDFLQEDARTRNGEFIAFAAHVFEKNREVEFAAAGDFPDGFVGRRTNAHGDVRLQFALETFADLSARHELPFAAGQGRRIHLEVHREGRFVDLEHRQGFGLLKVRDRRADREFFNAVHENDVARFGFVDELAVETLELQDLIDLHAARRVVGAVHDGDFHVRADAAAVDAAHADLAHVARVVERADLKLERSVGIVVANRHVLDHRVEDGAHVADLLQFFNVVRETRVAVQGRSVDHREVKLLFGGAELVEEVEGLIDDPVGTGARTVDLVDDHDRLQTEGEGLAGHEARLRHRAFHGVDEEQNAVDHREDAFDFAAEVRVPRGVDDVDVGPHVFDRAVLGENRDPAFAFEVVGVHHTFGHLLIVTEGARALQKAVHHRGLAVVNVRNDCNISNGSSHCRNKKNSVEKIRSDYTLMLERANGRGAAFRARRCAPCRGVLPRRRRGGVQSSGDSRAQCADRVGSARRRGGRVRCGARSKAIGRRAKEAHAPLRSSPFRGSPTRPPRRFGGRPRPCGEASSDARPRRGLCRCLRRAPECRFPSRRGSSS